MVKGIQQSLSQMLVTVAALLAVSSHGQDIKNYLPIPKQAQAALENKESAHLYYKTNYFVRPELYLKTRDGKFKEFSLSKLVLQKNATPTELRCLYVFLTGSPKCLKNEEISRSISSVDPKSDLLAWSREATKIYGVLQTRDMLSLLLKKRDHKNGELESRLQRATKNTNWISKDSVFADESLDRKKIGILFFMGVDVNDNSPNRDQIRLASEYARDLGFYAHTFQTGPTSSSETNATIINNDLKKHLRKVDAAIIVAASKGVADFLTWSFTGAQTYSKQERDKIKMFISLSGVIRESFVAKWLFEAQSFHAKKMRFLINNFRKDYVPGFYSLTKSPWRFAQKPSQLKTTFENLRWVSFAMLPEGFDGLSYLDPWNLKFQESLYRESSVRSPSDGLVETAASILPPNTMVEEHVIRAWGPHALSLGRYSDHTPIAPKAQRGRTTAQPEAGPELLNAFMRSIPSAWLK